MDEQSMSAGKTFNVDQAVFFSLTSDRAGEQFSTGLLSLQGCTKRLAAMSGVSVMIQCALWQLSLTWWGLCCETLPESHFSVSLLTSLKIKNV